MTGSGEPAPLPPLRRDLEIVPIEHEGRPMFLLQDHEGVNERGMALSPAGMAIASLLDGKNTASDLQALIARETGASVSAVEVEKLVGQLEKSDLLETAAVQAKRQKILQDFLANPARPAALKGAYPENTLELSGFLGKFFRDPKGPGRPLAEKPSAALPVLGLISPHIDLQRGGPAYAWAYGALAEAPPPDLIVALGVAHSSPNSPWVMTRKSYETPYGPMDVSRELYDDIRGRLWYDPTDDERVHRWEHSLEFQALWLKFL